MKMFRKVLSVLLSAALAASLYCGCVNIEVKKSESKVKMRTGELATMQSAEKHNDEAYPTTLFDDLNSLIMAFNADKVDSIYGLPDVVSRYISNHIKGTEVVLPTDYLGTLDLCMAVLKDNNDILNLLNDAIEKLTSDGTIDKLQKDYLESYIETGRESQYTDMPHYDNARTIKVAVTGNLPPIDYISTGGTPSGFGVALLSEIAKCEKINIELEIVSSGTRLIALKERAADVVFYVTKYSYDSEKYKDSESLDITDEISTTKPYYTSNVTKVVHSKLAKKLGLNVL